MAIYSKMISDSRHNTSITLKMKLASLFNEILLDFTYLKKNLFELLFQLSNHLLTG